MFRFVCSTSSTVENMRCTHGHTMYTHKREQSKKKARATTAAVAPSYKPGRHGRYRKPTRYSLPAPAPAGCGGIMSGPPNKSDQKNVLAEHFLSLSSSQGSQCPPLGCVPMYTIRHTVPTYLYYTLWPPLPPNPTHTLALLGLEIPTPLALTVTYMDEASSTTYPRCCYTSSA